MQSNLSLAIHAYSPTLFLKCRALFICFEVQSRGITSVGGPKGELAMSAKAISLRTLSGRVVRDIGVGREKKGVVEGNKSK